MFFRLRYRFNRTEVAVNRVIHKFLATIVKDESQDQPLEGLIEVFHLVSVVRLFKPMPIHNKERGEAFDQGLEGFEERMGKAA